MNYADKQAIDSIIAYGFFRYTAAVFIGPPSQPMPLNGTVSLIQMNGRRFGMTCDHVIRKYEQLHSNDPTVQFQVNLTLVDPIDRLIDRNRNLDFAVLDFGGLDLSGSAGSAKIGTDYFLPPSWPPSEVQIGQRVTISGFPGNLKFQQGSKLMVVATPIGAQPVTDVTRRYLICQLDRPSWRYLPGQIDNDIPQALGGMSGGPVFLLTDLANFSELYKAQFVGIVSEQLEPYDTLLVSKAEYIGGDGCISYA